MTIAKTSSSILASTTIAAEGNASSSALDASGAVGITITANVTFNASATAGAVLSILSSPDNTNWDTIPLDQVAITLTAGGTVQITLPVTPSVKYVKAKITNSDASYSITAATITAVLTTP
jgi:hypothetical protein